MLLLSVETFIKTFQFENCLVKNWYQQNVRMNSHWHMLDH